MDEACQLVIPCYFLCPISMQLMEDPVIVSTGITYDRESIEKWLFSCKKTTCPVTKVEISSSELTPNHTLRRLIQAWCAVNGNYDPRMPFSSPPSVQTLLDEAISSPKSRARCLQRLGSIVRRDENGRHQLQRADGGVEFLASVVSNKEDGISRNEAMSILNKMYLSESDVKSFLSDKNGIFLGSLLQVLDQNEGCQAQAHAMMLLRTAFRVADPDDLIAAKSDLFNQIARILRDRISAQATRAALKLLVEICPLGRNRIKAVETGAVSALTELLLDSGDRRTCELVLTALDQLCCCAEGRAEMLKHGAGVAMVSKKILRVSNAASERGVRILSSISKHCANSRVVNEMMQVGVVSKLCLVVQVDGNQKNKERAKEILRLHSRVWKDSPCIPPHLLSFYP